MVLGISFRSFLGNNSRALEFYMEGQHLPVGFGDIVDLLGKLFFQTGIPGDAQQGRAGTTEAEGCSCGTNKALDLIVICDHLFPVRLVNSVLHGISQKLLITQLQGFQHQGTMGDIIDRICPVILGGQCLTGNGGRQVEIRHQSQKLPIGMQGEIHAHRQTVIYHRCRAGFGITRKQSRQIVNHGHVLVNGKKVDIPSYLVKAGDVITVKARSNDYLKNVMSMIDLSCAPAWVTVDKDALKITFDRVPEREELDPEIKEQLVIEYYSK